MTHGYYVLTGWKLDMTSLFKLETLSLYKTLSTAIDIFQAVIKRGKLKKDFWKLVLSKHSIFWTVCAMQWHWLCTGKIVYFSGGKKKFSLLWKLIAHTLTFFLRLNFRNLLICEVVNYIWYYLKVYYYISTCRCTNFHVLIKSKFLIKL